MGDFNGPMGDKATEDFCYLINLESLIKKTNQNQYVKRITRIRRVLI